MESFSIKSVRSDSELVFDDYDGDHFTVQLVGSELSASLRVWGYTDCQPLVEMLAYLASLRADWSSPAEWSSIESEFAMKIRCDSWGHVLVAVHMQRVRGGPEDWKLDAEIETELGQLPKIASNAAQFFNVNAGS